MALDHPTQPGDIDHLIADDHAVVDRQFQHLEAGRGNRRVLVDQISFELALHAFAEETVLYPIWPEVGMTDEHDDAEHEHQEIVGTPAAFFGAAAVLDEAEQAQQEAADHLTRAFAGAGA
ncbi:hypothetical protein ACI79D_16420 [Geodermatophilus sp. SYSU D00708]